MALEQNIEQIFSGNDVTLLINVTDADGGGPLNLSGAQALIYAIGKNANASAIITRTLVDGITITDAAQGSIQISIPAASLEPLKGTYYHELRLTNSMGRIVTLMYGSVEIAPNLIRIV